MSDKVTAGDPIRIPATSWNTLADVADDYTSGRLGPAHRLAPGQRGGDAWIRNASGLRARFEFVLLGDPVILPSVRLEEFQRQLALSGLVIPGMIPEQPDIAVLLTPLGDTKIGRAVTFGSVPCRVSITTSGDRWAKLAANNNSNLVSTDDACELGVVAKIIWAEPGTGLLWAIVRL